MVVWRPIKLRQRRNGTINKDIKRLTQWNPIWKRIKYMQKNTRWWWNYTQLSRKSQYFKVKNWWMRKIKKN